MTKLQLKSGSSVGMPSLSLDPNPITIFVGPNNSGKSTLLREIEVSLENPGQGKVVLDHVVARPITLEEMNTVILARGQRQQAPGQPELYTVSRLKPGKNQGPGGTNVSFRKGDQGQWQFSEPNGEQITTRAASLFTVFLDGQSRLSLLDNAPTGSLLSPPNNHLAALFRNDVARAGIAKLSSEAFGEYFTIDATPMTEFHAKLSPRAPIDLEEERGTGEKTIAFHKLGLHINTFSDGVKAYIGLLSALSSSIFKLILIDEPEAFLHPPLARRLGRNIAELAAAQNACVIAATHDADFVMGAVQAGTGVNVVRLTHRAQVATARHLPAGDLAVLMRDPLLRSAGVIRSLFHAAVVVCEADADRAFYEEVNERLLTYSNDGVGDALFLNVQNKQTVHRVIRPLRSMGIPTAAVVDLDILKSNDLEKLLDAAFVPETQSAALVTMISDVRSEFLRCNAQADGAGLPALDDKARSLLEMLIADLEKIGVFVVPVGELEDWLIPLGVTGKKREWLPKMFDAMGTDPTDPAYVEPTDNDVWQFVRGIGRWAGNSNRWGIPP